MTISPEEESVIQQLGEGGRQRSREGGRGHAVGPQGAQGLAKSRRGLMVTVPRRDNSGV